MGISPDDDRSMAEDILEGIFCEICGQFVGEPVGHPRKCSDCKPQKKRKHRHNGRKNK